MHFRTEGVPTSGDHTYQFGTHTPPTDGQFAVPFDADAASIAALINATVAFSGVTGVNPGFALPFFEPVVEFPSGTTFGEILPAIISNGLGAGNFMKLSYSGG